MQNNRKKITILLTAALILLALSSCGQTLEHAASVLTEISKDMPAEENTYTRIADVNEAMQDVLRRGEETFEFNIADVTEEDLAHIADHMSTFWGEPKEYSVGSVFHDVEGIVPDKAVEVKRVTNTFALSNNYYVYEYIRGGVPIPEDQPRAKEIAGVLESLETEIFAGSDGTAWGQTLAAHDWLVANLDYDENTPEFSDQNGSYGALVDKRTMCQGYAEALELILRCYTDIEVTQVVGDAQGNVISDDYSGWIGHAWNAVLLDGQWVHIDATFDDPRGNPEGAVSHFYFAQNDAVMSADHRWQSGYFPICDGGNFPYFRNNNLFADDMAGFEEIVTGILSDSKPAQFEVAAVGVTLNEENIQFMFKIDPDIGEVFWSEQTYGEIHVQTVEPGYEDEGTE
ncbi:MAG: hypothetical protein LBN12_08500 [Clostridiales Family XIII bacterium]|jgi:hypothetical protein|nr:hypothetical protein [Clostridiales Family XIII bacterium]